MNVSPTPEQRGKRLTIGWRFIAFFMPLCTFLVFAAWSATAWARASKMEAGVCGLIAILQLVGMPALWKRYRLVKQEVAIYVSSQPSTPLPKPAAVGVVLVLTAVIAIASLFTFLGVRANFNTLIGWMIAAPVLLLLWLLAAYFWYRALSGERQPVTVEVSEQTEGVWPPAPLVSARHDNKD